MLKELLTRQKSVIVDNWVRRILGSYPSDSLKFLTSQKDRFANPIGCTITSNAGAIFDELLGESDTGVAESLVTEIVRIRAVQDFSPSQAIRFVFDLKEAIQDVIGKDLRESGHCGELEDLDFRIDNLGLSAFDSYMSAREKVFQIRMNELKSRSLQAMVQNGGVGQDD